MRATSKRITIALLLIAAASLTAQTTNNVNVGLPPNASYDGTGIESVQANNGNLHIEIPLFTLPGRGLSVNVSYVYDSKGWQTVWKEDQVHTVKPAVGVNGAPPTQQWRVNGPLATASGMVASVVGTCAIQNPPTSILSWTVAESDGTSHAFPPSGGTCVTVNGNLRYAIDGSGYVYNGNVIRPDGVNIHQTGSGGSTAWVMEDPNGNKISRLIGSYNVTDTMGRTVQVDLTLNSQTGKYELPYNDTSGTQQKIIVTKSPVTIQTHFCSAGCNEYSNTWQMPTEILLPNGMKYTIAYNQGSYGTPSSITLPTGAVISYTYGSTPEPCQLNGQPGQSFNFDNGGPRVTSRTVTVGSQVSTWNYAYECGTSTSSTWIDKAIVTSPAGDDVVHTLTHYVDDASQDDAPSLAPSKETQTDYYAGARSGNVILKSVATVYQAASVGPHMPISVTTTWPQQGSLVSKEETDWDMMVDPVGSSIYCCWFSNLTWGNVVEKREYAFGVGSPGSLVHKTHFQYAHLSGNTNYNSNYTTLNIANRVTQKTVYDSSGTTVVADAKTTYDGAALTTTSGVVGHDYTVGTYRGNATQSQVWLNTTSTWIPTNNTYNDLGNLLTTTDPGGHQTSFSYADSWAAGAPLCGTAANAQGYLTQTSAPDTVNSQSATVHHRARTKYFPCTGQKQLSQDENDILAGATRGTSYTYDAMLRPSTVLASDGGQTSFTYGDTANAVSVTTTTKIDTTKNLVTVSQRDGLGREKQSQLTSDPEGTVYVDTTYDLLGRKSTVSNPYRNTSEATYGVTTYNYDALGRVTKEIPPDGTSSTNNVQTAYGAQTTGILGLTTTVTDQAAKQRKSVANALGQLVDVWEPDPASGSLVNETQYQYDTLGNLLCVEQHGNVSGTGCTVDPSNDATSPWRVRRFTYDSLSRLLTAKNPESGTVSWTYDNDSNVLTKTDPRNTITYNYDQLHRVATTGTTHAKAYSNTDPPVDYFYDQTSFNGLTITEGVGHETGMSDATGSSASTFDTEGRVLVENKTINIAGVTPSAVTKQLTYTYNLDGSMASLTYPDGKIVNYGYNAAGHALSAVDVANLTNYVTSATYAPHGDVSGYVNGYTGITNSGIPTTNTWNKRFQPSTFTAATQGTGAQTLLSLSFAFNLGVDDNGILTRIANGVHTGRNVNYTYDQLNRITAGYHDGSDWGNNYVVDIWGNLYQKNAYTGKTAYDPLTVAITSKNQFNAYSYDASGNLNNDQLGHTYSYDAENRPYSAGGLTYYYDGTGERVAKSNGKLYWFGTGTAPVLESDASGSITAEYIFFNGKRVAQRRASDNTIHYYFADQVGSANLVTNADGTFAEQDIEYHPYGEEQVYLDTIGQEYRFTGKEHDPETNNDYFGARYYGSTFGRFLTPDWSASPEPIPYEKPGLPQTLNLYSYVGNNPITGIDPDGHDGWDFITGALNATLSDIGVSKRLSGNEDFTAGQGAGDLATTVAGGYATLSAAAADGGIDISSGGAALLMSSPIQVMAVAIPAKATATAASHLGDDLKNAANSFSKSGDDSNKKVPNPDGSKGKPDHQQTANEEAAKMGPNGQREVRVGTPGGEKQSRVIDAAQVKNGKVTKATQVIRPNKDGTPPAREVRAAKDIQKATGVEPKLVPVRPCTSGC
jgi:RHS repeat-associated protein